MKYFLLLPIALLLIPNYTVRVDGPVHSASPGASITTQGPVIREITAYNPNDPYQTDDSPCIGAANKNICTLLEQGVAVCAANFVPLGTTIYLPEIDHECVVLDRTSKKYGQRVDMAFLDHWEAVEWGKKLMQVITK